MTPVSQSPSDDDDARAAEYVLHLLAPDERAAVEARLDGDGALRARVAFWADHLAALAAEIAPVTPPGDLRSRLERAIGTAHRATQRPRRRFSLFGLLGGAALAAALGLVVVTQLPDVRLPSAFTPAYEAGISGQEGALVISVAYSDATGELRVNRTAGQAPAGRVLQLWVIADGAPAPVSLGLLADEAETVLSVPEDLRTALPGSTIAVSEEPPGGSPEPVPTGEVLGTAPLNEV